MGGVWWYLQESQLREEQWLKSDIAWNTTQIEKLESIVSRQAEIRKELATQSLMLKETLEKFAELGVEHADIVDKMDRFNQNFSYRMGLHNGKHSAK